MASIAEQLPRAGEGWSAALLRRRATVRSASVRMASGGLGDGGRSRAEREHPDGGEERRSAVRASQRTRIIAAAASCARIGGVGEVSVGAIVAASRVSRRTFYDIFENTEDCMLATFEHGVRRAAARVLPAYAGEEHWREAMRAGLAALLTYLEEEPTFGGFCVVDAAGAGRAVLRRRAEVLESVATAVEQGRAAAEDERGLTRCTGQIVVGGLLAVLQNRLLADEGVHLSALHGELMAEIVRPYLGAAAAEQELRRAGEDTHARAATAERASGLDGPLAQPRLRWTYRTIAAVKEVAGRPGCSNRAIGDAVGILDAGQISKLLSRLRRAGLIENEGGALAAAGTANAWYLTERGREVAEQLWGSPASWRE